MLQFSAVHVKVKDNLGSFGSDLAVWGSEVGVDGADPGSEAEGTPLELYRTVEGRRNCDSESSVGDGRRNRKTFGWAPRSMRKGSILTPRYCKRAGTRQENISTPLQSTH